MFKIYIILYLKYLQEKNILFTHSFFIFERIFRENKKILSFFDFDNSYADHTPQSTKVGA